MYCTQCGAELSEQASFCGRCGTPRWTGDGDDPYSEDSLAARGFKLCVSCRSEIKRDARVCDRCDARQPTEIESAPPKPAPEVSTYRPDYSRIVSEPGGPQLATISYRCGALLVDLIIIVTMGVIVSLINEEAGLWFSIATTFTYFIVLEAMYGQTVGKRLFGIVVVTEEHAPIGWGKSVGRNLLRIVDQLPVFYILGLIMIAQSDKNQRVGDRAARTIVVKTGTSTVDRLVSAIRE